MKISTKGVYGLRAMLDLAIHQDQQPVALKSIASRQDISDHYLEQIFAILRKGGLVKSIKGQQGGYLIEKSLSSISVYDVLTLLEGKMFSYDEQLGNNHVDKVIHNQVWKPLETSIESVILEKDLETLALEVKKEQAAQIQMYYI